MTKDTIDEGILSGGGIPPLSDSGSQAGSEDQEYGTIKVIRRRPARGQNNRSRNKKALKEHAFRQHQKVLTRKRKNKKK